MNGVVCWSEVVPGTLLLHAEGMCYTVLAITQAQDPHRRTVTFLDGLRLCHGETHTGVRVSELFAVIVPEGHGR